MAVSLDQLLMEEGVLVVHCHCRSAKYGPSIQQKVHCHWMGADKSRLFTFRFDLLFWPGIVLMIFRWCYNDLCDQLPGSPPSVVIWKPMLSFLQISLDFPDLQVSTFSLLCLFTQLRGLIWPNWSFDHSTGFAFPTTLSANSAAATAFSNWSYLFVIGVEIWSHWSPCTDLTGRSGICVWYQHLAVFFQSNFSLIHGFPLEVWRLVVSNIL